VHFHALVGFDSATVPVHVALYYLIKASEPQTPVGTIPAGAICAFGGPLNLAPARWLKCDGASYGVSLYPDLLEAIFYNYGGDGKTVLSVPDLRGYFLRGTDHGMNRDPDAAGRHELSSGGNIGDNVGSAQFYATASPAALAVASTGDHSHDISAIPQDDHHAAWGASGPLAFNCMLWTNAVKTSSQNGDHTHTLMGGDHESRPENIYSSYLVASDNLPESAPPIGTVMSFAGDFTDPGLRAALLTAGWLPCDGSLVRISAFPELYRVVGTTFGSAPLKFAVPDLRGYFVTGAGKVALGTLQATSTTGVPGTPIVSSTGGGHAHTMPNVPPDTHVIDVVAGVDLAEQNPSQSPTSTSGAHNHAIRGGDRESRPVNVTVDHIIRFQ
jgi:microcystin-dependent protein